MARWRLQGITGIPAPSMSNRWEANGGSACLWYRPGAFVETPDLRLEFRGRRWIFVQLCSGSRVAGKMNQVSLPELNLSNGPDSCLELPRGVPFKGHFSSRTPPVRFRDGRVSSGCLPTFGRSSPPTAKQKRNAGRWAVCGGRQGSSPCKGCSSKRARHSESRN